jgi:hypothetical protein
MKEKHVGYSACITNHLHCKECGWPIVDACCNDEFIKFKDAKNWDWWYYCSNKGCKNHDGEGVFQTNQGWVEENVEL